MAFAYIEKHTEFKNYFLPLLRLFRDDREMYFVHEGLTFKYPRVYFQQKYDPEENWSCLLA